MQQRKRRAKRHTPEYLKKRRTQSLLRSMFEKAKTQLFERLVHEQAMKEARGRGTIEGTVQSLFKKLDYKEIMEKGVSRMVNGRVVHYTGEQAVRAQIRSMRARASAVKIKSNFIQNYKETMIKVGYSRETASKVAQMLNQLSADELSDITESGELPSINYIYGDGAQTTDRDILDKIERTKINVKKEKRGQVLRERADEWKSYIRKKMQQR